MSAAPQSLDSNIGVSKRRSEFAALARRYAFVWFLGVASLTTLITVTGSFSRNSPRVVPIVTVDGVRLANLFDGLHKTDTAKVGVPINGDGRCGTSRGTWTNKPQSALSITTVHAQLNCQATGCSGHYVYMD